MVNTKYFGGQRKKKKQQRVNFKRPKRISNVRYTSLRNLQSLAWHANISSSANARQER
jgi:hypothetical protein